MRLLTVARQLARCALLPSFRTFARSTKRPPKPGDKYKLGESAEMKQLKMMILNAESKEEFEEAERMLYAQEDSITHGQEFENTMDTQLEKMIAEGIESGATDQQILSRMVGRPKPSDFVKHPPGTRRTLEPSTEAVPAPELIETSQKSDLELLEEAQRKFDTMAEDRDYDSEDFENLSEVAKFTSQQAREMKFKKREKKPYMPFGDQMKAKDLKETSALLGEMRDQAVQAREEEKEAARLQTLAQAKYKDPEEFAELAQRDYEKSAKEMGYFISDPRELEGFSNEEGMKERETDAQRIERELKVLTEMMQLDHAGQKHEFYKLRREARRGQKLDLKLMRMRRMKEARELAKKEKGRSLLEMEFEFDEEEQKFAEQQHERTVAQFDSEQEAYYFKYDQRKKIRHQSYERVAQEVMSELLDSQKASIVSGVRKELELEVSDIRLNKAMTVVNVWWDASHILDRSQHLNQAYLVAIQKKLTQTAPYFRGQFGKRMGMKYAPEIRFFINQTHDIYFKQFEEFSELYFKLKDQEQVEKESQMNRNAWGDMKERFDSLTEEQKENLKRQIGSREYKELVQVISQEEVEQQEKAGQGQQGKKLSKLERKKAQEWEKLENKYEELFKTETEELPATLEEAMQKFTINYNFRPKLLRTTKRSRPNPFFIQSADGLESREEEQPEIKELAKTLGSDRAKLEGATERKLKGRDAQGKRVRGGKRKKQQAKGERFWASLEDI